MSRSFEIRGRRKAAGVLLSGVVMVGAIAVWTLGATAPASAQPPVGATDVAAAEKTGVTLYQVNGFTGKVPLKKVYKVDPSGDSGHYELEFASANMNTQMAWKAKFKLPAGMVFKSLELSTFNGPKSVTTAGADSWDGQTLIDEVTVSPWSMNRLLQQCIDHLKQGDGSFKESATFDLVANETELVRGKGICTFPNAPPGSASSYSAKATPKTRVTAYIVNFGEQIKVDRRPQRLTSQGSPHAQSDQPSRIPTPSRPAPPRGSSTSGRQPPLAKLVLPAGPRPSGGPAQGTAAAKETFERKKPH